MVNLIVLCCIIVGVVFLQIFLSKSQNKWLGFLLPIISFAFSLLATLSISTFQSLTTSEVVHQQISENGEVIEEIVVEQGNVEVQNNSEDSVVLLFVSVFVLYNIPTAILLCIYFACREKIKKEYMLDKMNIQDLE